MSIRFASGRNRVIGKTQDYETPIELDPAAYRGASVQGRDGLVHYSNGLKWIATAPVLSTLIDGGNADTDLERAAKIDLGTAQP